MLFRVAKLTMCLMLAAAPFCQSADAARGDTRSEARPTSPRTRVSPTPIFLGRSLTASRARRTSAGNGGGGGGISCVPYARSVTGMEISGNGGDWWYNAAGRYARGQRPRVGSVLAFASSGGMRSGHVAVVSRVLQPRLIEIDHSNWGGPGIRRGQIMHNVQVMDVSSDNSWSRVRVQVGWTAENFGREYPTQGFIHNAPANSYAEADEGVRTVAYSYAQDTGDRHSRRASHFTASRSGRSRVAQVHSRQSRTVAARSSQGSIRLAQARTTR
ncbi:MAG: amidase [Rubritepida sp.]|nr:amidase [Rubritepida sp.]